MPKSVWIVDDDEDVRGVLGFALEFEGHQVETFATGTEALRKLKSLPPADLPGFIVLDYMMPEMDGVAFIKILKSEEKLKAIPIALCTAMGSSEELNLPSEIERLNKPMNLEDLLALVKKYSH